MHGPNLPLHGATFHRSHAETIVLQGEALVSGHLFGTGLMLDGPCVWLEVEKE